LRRNVAHLLKQSDAEQKAYVNSAFDHGLPQASVDSVTQLVRARSAILAPILGDRIVAALKAKSPIDAFEDKTVDPQSAIMAAASAIAYAGDENALKELAKLLSVDERRFGWVVGYALADGGSRTFFPVVYKGYELGSAPLDAKMTAWIEKQLTEDANSGEPTLAGWWAAAMVERLGRAPGPADWANDPIVKKLKPEIAQPVRADVLKLAAEEDKRKTEH
jgi:hypothetical protein